MKLIETAFVILVFALALTEAAAQTMPANNKNKVEIKYTAKDFPVSDIGHKSWAKAKEVVISKYWSGKAAPPGRQFKAKLLWSDTAIYVRFEANQTEPLIISDVPNLKTKTDKLWDRDVCEIFLAPKRNDRRKYYEFEIAPNGEWTDLFIDYTGTERQTDWRYKSGMDSFAAIEKNTVLMAIRIEWKAFGTEPKAGDIWLGNLLRCIGKDPNRGYLAWSPTETEVPNFHVPEKFGEFEFVK